MTKKKSIKKAQKEVKKSTAISKKKTNKRTTKRKSRATNSGAGDKKMGKIIWACIQFFLIRSAVVLFVLILAYSAILDIQIKQKFEGKKWALPSHVYTRPMDIYLGQHLKKSILVEELEELGYQLSSNLNSVGSYVEYGSVIKVHQRSFQYWDGPHSQQIIEIHFLHDQISRIVADNQETEIIRFEPRLFGSVSLQSHQDRSLVTLAEVPQSLIDALIAIEDRQFYSHFGVNPIGIMRALVSNIKAGKTVQGGSTLTQQLVKNYYLNSDRTISRKLKEMIMAVLLELHYSKQEILQAYINEVYISQVGARAIHGFALGSQHFYGRPLQELELAEVAMLAGLINGPNYYHPVRNSKRALKRRNLVLNAMKKLDMITQEKYQAAATSELGISRNALRPAPLSYTAFSGLVRLSLKDQYRAKDLSSEGLKIYTTLNPRIQKQLEKSVIEQVNKIEQEKNIKFGTLEVAAAVIRTDNGEVVGLLGGRKSRFSGFNRAIDARRPVGSLLKPFVYLTALEDASRYSLATSIKDQSITVEQAGSPDWKPSNYNKKEHGDVLLIDALSHSYNLATVRLGMQLGLENVKKTIQKVGYEKPFTPLPSMLLGAVPMNILDVGQMYLTLASGGFKTPLKSVRAVLNEHDQPLSRYPLNIKQVIDPEHSAVINYALQEVMKNGTGRYVNKQFQSDLGLAGKTGTTNNYRDSWFAGFSGNYLVVVWLGRDDNKSSGLSGASGAAKVWANIMRKLPLQPLKLMSHRKIMTSQIYSSQDPQKKDCSLVRELPIIVDSLPLNNLSCAYKLDRKRGDKQDNDELRYFEPRKRKKQSFWQRIFG